MKLSDYVSSFIAKQGVGHVFLLPGGGCMHLVDSVGKESGLKFVACLHEQGASIAADGYAQYSGNLGVALVTTGPGSTNAITGVAGSWIESVPVLILSGQVKTADIKPSQDMRMKGFQEVDTENIVKPITKYAVTVRDPKLIRYHLEKAVYLARHGRPGPVWLDIPLDIQAASIEPSELKRFDPEEFSTSASQGEGLNKDLFKRLIGMISASKRPVIIAGNGIRLGGNFALFVETIERLGIPVLMTWKGCDLMDDQHPLYFGRPGVLAQRGANFIQQNADLVIAVGARLDFGQIGYASQTFARGAKKVIVDIDALELAKFNFLVELPLHVDAGEFWKGLHESLGEYQRPNWSEWVSRCKNWKSNYPVVTEEYRNQKEYANSYVLVEKLSEMMSSDDLLVPGSSGACSDVCLQSFKVKKGQRVLNSPGIGAMGFGIPQTIGACIASGGKRTVNVNGDGGFQMNIQELETVHRLGLPIKYFILNNQGYASMRVTHRNYFQGRLVASDASSGLTLPNVRKIADAYGISNNRISFNGEIGDKIKEAFETKGPFITEVMIDPEEVTAPKVKSFIGEDGKMVSKPQEDMAPFLDRKEFLKNMIVSPLSDFEKIQ
ncbi:MAG: thiamine pyrophosphate-binding protein [Actinobacteria bacterium]|nr:thiamine pyrophosphate-binding protein [Actinomycetota bacterium]